MKILATTSFALTAFAFNSILCRFALRGEEIDAAGFTAVRLATGAAMLAAILVATGKTGQITRGGSWVSAILLFAYAIFFSLAYLELTTATGALILFGSVQLTMMLTTVIRGERPRTLEWIGSAVALGGLVYLVFPGLQAPRIQNAGLMAAAGIAWAGYTLRGKGSEDPVGDTAGNFVRALPLAAIALAVFWPSVHLSTKGVVLAVVSGAVASGIGYAIWYTALRELSSTRAAVLQLSVPMLAAFGGVLLLGETLTVHLIAASVLIIGGVLVTISAKK